MSQSLIVALIVIVAIAAIAIVAVFARNAGRPRLRELPDESKDRFARSWQLIEARFIEDPRAAVQEADKTVVMILSERGAIVTDGNRVPPDLFNARTLRDKADTESMRTAILLYKRMVDDAVGSARLAPETRRREMAS